ncbi:TPA: hypothetical protein M4731_000932 [Salmonella enterica]|nr:hypothetical protein [Salmonella enterica]MCH5741734.1 hypothetical protein [Salmonella enterica]MCH5745722.1 hypothetical protein [Salmonella enterica]MCH5765942.1 hypothetical protein [Salmonella enterica]MCH5771460.1 hypothetical protein [Salmonella enterica]
MPPENPHHLSEGLPEQAFNKYRSMLTGLLNNIFVVDSAPAVRAGGTGGVVNITDFRPAVHGEIVVAAWALKRNVTHHW